MGVSMERPELFKRERRCAGDLRAIFEVLMGF